MGCLFVKYALLQCSARLYCRTYRLIDYYSLAAKKFHILKPTVVSKDVRGSSSIFIEDTWSCITWPSKVFPKWSEKTGQQTM